MIYGICLAGSGLKWWPEKKSADSRVEPQNGSNSDEQWYRPGPPCSKLPCFSISRDEEKFGKQKVFMKTGLTKHQKTPTSFSTSKGIRDCLRMAPGQQCQGAGEVRNHL